MVDFDEYRRPSDPKCNAIIEKVACGGEDDEPTYMYGMWWYVAYICNNGSGGGEPMFTHVLIATVCGGGEGVL